MVTVVTLAAPVLTSRTISIRAALSASTTYSITDSRPVSTNRDSGIARWTAVRGPKMRPNRYSICKLMSCIGNTETRSSYWLLSAAWHADCEWGTCAGPWLFLEVDVLGHFQLGLHECLSLWAAPLLHSVQLPPLVLRAALFLKRPTNPSCGPTFMVQAEEFS